MNTKYTKKVLDNYKKVLVNDLKRQLNKPNSNLDKSISARKLDNKMGIGVYMNEYGINVNQGRSAGRFSNGRSELPRSFMDWVERQPRKKAEDGKYYTIKESAFLIWRSISQTGIKPTRFIDIVIDKVEPKLTLDLANAYLRDLNEELDKATPNAKKS
jgi:hypothetical protein